MIKSFDKVVLRQVRREMEAAIKPLADKLGVAFTVGSIRFSPSNATIKVEAAVLGQNGEAQTSLVTDFKKYAVLFGLKDDDLGKQVTINRSVYTIIGLAPRSRKYPVLAKSARGTVYKFSVSSVLRGLGRSSESVR